MQKSLSLLSTRQSLGLTQVQIAEKLDVTPEYISMIEHGKKTPSKKLLNKLGLLLNKVDYPLDAPKTTSISCVREDGDRVNQSCQNCAKYALIIAGLESDLREARTVIRDLAAALATRKPN